jgi:hypothetical protein
VLGPRFLDPRRVANTAMFARVGRFPVDLGHRLIVTSPKLFVTSTNTPVDARARLTSQAHCKIHLPTRHPIERCAGLWRIDFEGLNLNHSESKTQTCPTRALEGLFLW